MRNLSKIWERLIPTTKQFRDSFWVLLWKKKIECYLNDKNYFNYNKMKKYFFIIIMNLRRIIFCIILKIYLSLKYSHPQQLRNCWFDILLLNLCFPIVTDFTFVLIIEEFIKT